MVTFLGILVAVIGFIGIGATILMYALLKSIERGE